MAEQTPPPENKPPSKFPDFQELGNMANKFFKGIKNSITEIVGDYKMKRSESTEAEAPAPKEQSAAAEKTSAEVKQEAAAETKTTATAEDTTHTVADKENEAHPTNQDKTDN